MLQTFAQQRGCRVQKCRNAGNCACTLAGLQSAGAAARHQRSHSGGLTKPQDGLPPSPSLPRARATPCESRNGNSNAFYRVNSPAQTDGEFAGLERAARLPARIPKRLPPPGAARGPWLASDPDQQRVGALGPLFRLHAMLLPVKTMGGAMAGT